MNDLKEYKCGETLFGCWCKLVRQQIKYFEEVLAPISLPEWHTSNRILLENDQLIVRDFSIGDSPKVPILILPPQAGHHSNICDYDKGQSLVEAALKAGHTRVFAIEWLTATQERKDEGIGSFIDSTDLVVDLIRDEKVNLVGLCQGGWQAAIYTALYPEKVNTLTLAGAPIDFKADGGYIQALVDSLPQEFFKSLIVDGLMPGAKMLEGWKNMNFLDHYWWGYCDLWANIEDKVFLTRRRKFRDWYEYTQDLPGGFYLEVVDKLFRRNHLIKGELEVNGRRVDLAKITCPLFMIAGEQDEITLVNQLFNAADYVSSTEISMTVVDAGHIGLFMGSKVVQNRWPEIFKKIAQNP